MPTIPQAVRLSLKNILVPTDFSPASKAALRFAVSLARIYDSTLFIAHAVPVESHLGVPLDRLPAQDDVMWLDARAKLDNFRDGRVLDGMQVKTLLDRGDLSESIPSMIREQNVDLIVLGTHGRRGVSKVVLGSGAETIYRSASCPVLTVGPHVPVTDDWKPRRILCPVDVAEGAEEVLRFAFSLAEENQSNIVILQAVPLVPWQHRPAVAERMRRALGHFLPAEADEWCTPEILVRWEHPVEAILQTAQERESDLIVMSVRKSRVSAFASHLPWPVASEVVSRANSPVLTLRV